MGRILWDTEKEGDDPSKMVWDSEEDAEREAQIGAMLIEEGIGPKEGIRRFRPEFVTGEGAVTRLLADHRLTIGLELIGTDGTV